MMNMHEMDYGFDNPAYLPDTPEKKQPTTGGVHPTDVHFVKNGTTGDPAVNIPVSAEDGSSIKPNVRQQVKALRSKIVRQVIYSILRNFLCYLFAFCLLVLLVNAKEFSDWDALTEVVLLMLLCFGLVGIPAQCLHIYRELRNTRRTVIPQMLVRWKYRDDFVSMCQAWQTSAPYIALEISLRCGTISSDDPNHWTKTTRKTDKKLTYRVWTDNSENIHAIPWNNSSRGNWIIVSKDYRSVNKETEKSIKEDVDAFSLDSLYNNYKYFMRRDFILDVTDGQPFPDAMPYVVFTERRSKFYNFTIYKIFLCLCLDSVYNLIFHALTKNMGEYCIVKYIER